MTSTRVRAGLIATTALSALMMAGCSSSSEPEASESASSAPEASETAVALETLTEGKLTIATGEPAYEPWVVGDDPESGEGFEAAVAYAVAEQMGFAAEDVVWVRSSFDSAIAPGAKDWDMNIQQFSITEERKNAVDFSSPYYTTTQAVVTVEGSAAADAASVADLADLQVGVPSGTTSYTVAAEVLGDQNLAVFNSSEDTVAALTSGQIDAFVIDLPSAFYLAAAVLDGGVILGQFEDATGGDEFGFVLPKGSTLTEAVTEAVDALREDGTLAAIETEWLSDAVDVPVLK
ncbi:ABC transporter substrate-binding protein [Demequina sp. SYSU T00192]|uniref:ABC transporter substrate-binding protein n=1 Tax=Demequina litoralis TaxID=3051660 RepID=A0ABT8G8X0_9MICO|nr:ABC transporter substrate-binding protein [Demequina sp. SYSU T00192]MDN4475589.1 ABC transporter substrate-binding protein [Demequina sp. SYSU T00192]